MNNNKTEIIDEKSQNKILNKNTVNLSKISTDVNQFINNTKIEFRQNLLKNIVNELSIFEGDIIEEIKKDQANIKQLNNPEQTEKYAREKYYMKKDSEDIYVIEFEGDTIEKEELK